MQDLTQGSIPKHILKLAYPIAIGMVFQTLYYLVDLFFVARLGDGSRISDQAQSTLPAKSRANPPDNHGSISCFEHKIKLS